MNPKSSRAGQTSNVPRRRFALSLFGDGPKARVADVSPVVNEGEGE